MFVRCVVCCVGRGPCDELITRSQKSCGARVSLCVCVCVCLIMCDLETSTMRRPRPAPQKKIVLCITTFVENLSKLAVLIP